MKKITFTTNNVIGALAAFFNSNTTYTLKFNVVPYTVYKDVTGVHVSTNYSGKMQYMHGITGTCITNPFCIAMQAALDENGEKAFVCGDCYATAVYNSVAELYNRNGEFLNNGIIHTVPYIESQYFRFNSHGELISELEYLNYYFIAACNPGKTTALWTKRPEIIERVHEMLGLKKLKNLLLVLSSPRKNEKISLADHPLFDKSFTVYTAEYAQKHGIKITCGANACNSCGRCYTRRTDSVVAEMLKSDNRKGKGNGKGKGKKAA